MIFCFNSFMIVKFYIFGFRAKRIQQQPYKSTVVYLIIYTITKTIDFVPHYFHVQNSDRGLRLLLILLILLRLWNNIIMRVCRWRASCVAVEGNPRFAVSAATLTCKCGCRSLVWSVLIGRLFFWPFLNHLGGGDVLVLFYILIYCFFLYKTVNRIRVWSSYISVTRLISSFAVN